MTCAASQANDSVSLVGISADRDNGRAVIELHISGPADFQINRFTTGDWVSVWSDSFAISDNISEIPLELDRPDLADLVTGAALVNESRKSAIHLFLGPAADRRGVCITEDGDTVRVYIPTQVEPVEEPPLAGQPEVQPAFDVPRPESLPVETVAPTITVDVAELNGTVGEGAPVDVGSFYLPREEAPVASADEDPTGINDEVSVTPPTKTAKSEPKIEIEFRSPPPVPFKGPEKPEPGINSLETPASAAQMNYQYLRSDNGASSDAGAEDAVGEPPSMEDMMEAATKMATEMLGEMYQDAAGSQSADNTPRPITTAGGFYDPYQAAALIAQDPEIAPLLRDGKEALADIRIELFEIVSSPLDQAITLLVAPTGYNIIVDSSVGSNNVSLSFKDSQTTLKSALDLLTRTYGLAYSVQANTIVVASKDQIEGQLVEYETQLFVLSYADPKSVKTILTSTNLLKDNQVEIYTGEELYPEVNDSTELSTESNSEGTEIKRIESNLSSTPRNAVLVKAVPEQMAVIAAVIQKLDRQPKVVKLEVRVCEASKTALEDLGISVQTNDQATATPLVTTWTEVQEPLNSFANPLGNEDFSLGSFNRSQLQFIAQLNSQIQEGSVEVLAQPTLSTVEGKQAIYFAGERVPYIAEVSYTQTGAQVSVDFLNVGVTLNFKPRLDNDGKLTIDVNPIISSLLEFRMIGELMEAPRTSSRQMATTVRVSNEEPFVLSGLITETERKTITKVPLLGDLPLVGKIFRNKNLKGERTEIIVVVIPHIMD